MVSPSNPSITAAGKIVIVSGGSEGIGLAIANAFEIASASEVILVARNETTLKQVRSSLQAVCLNTSDEMGAACCLDCGLCALLKQCY